MFHILRGQVFETGKDLAAAGFPGHDFKVFRVNAQVRQGGLQPQCLEQELFRQVDAALCHLPGRQGGIQAKDWSSSKMYRIQRGVRMASPRPWVMS